MVLLIGGAAQAHLIGGSFFAPKGQAVLVGAAVFLGWTLAASLGLFRPPPSGFGRAARYAAAE